MSEVQFAHARALQIAPVSFIEGARPSRLIIVPNEEELLTKSYYARLAIAVADLKLPRRKIPDWMADCLYKDDVEFRFQFGGRYETQEEDIEKAFGGDLSFRWLSDFIQSAGTEPKQRPQRSLEFRLRLLALSFWVAKPEVAKHFYQIE